MCNLCNTDVAGLKIKEFIEVFWGVSLSLDYFSSINGGTGPQGRGTSVKEKTADKF